MLSSYQLLNAVRDEWLARKVTKKKRVAPCGPIIFRTELLYPESTGKPVRRLGCVERHAAKPRFHILDSLVKNEQHQTSQLHILYAESSYTS